MKIFELAKQWIMFHPTIITFIIFLIAIIIDIKLENKKENQEHGRRRKISLIFIISYILGGLFIPYLSNELTDKYGEHIENERLYNEAVDNKDNEYYQEAHVGFDKLIQSEPTNARYYYQDGLTYYNEREYEKAISRFEEALKLDTDNVSIYYNMTRAYYELDNYDEAFASVTHALDLEPESIKCLSYRADILFNKEEYDLAYKDYEKVLSNPIKSTNLGIAYYREAVCLFRLGDLSGSKIKIEKAITIKDDDDYRDFLDLLHKYEEVKREKSVTTLNLLGNAYGNVGWYKDALKNHLKALELLVDNDVLNFNVAFDYYKLADYDNAKKYINYAIKLSYNPDYIAFKKLIIVRKKKETGEDSAQKEIALGKAYYDYGWTENAIDSFRRAIEYDPEDVTINDYINICEMKKYCDHSDYESCDAQEIMDLIMALYKKEMYYGCVNECEKYIEKEEFQTKDKFYHYYGCALCHIENYEKGVEMLKMAYQLNPDEGYTWN